jgi:hypothetical protein
MPYVRTTEPRTTLPAVVAALRGPARTPADRRRAPRALDAVQRTLRGERAAPGSARPAAR